jgi:electron transfer flavoprotein alpha subunit
MARSRELLIIAEHLGGEPKRIALELATKAHQLAGQTGGGVSAVLVGPGARAAAEKLAEYGVQRAFISEDERFERFPIVAEAGVIEQAIAAVDPGLILFGASGAGRDLSGRIGARLSVGVITGATGVEFAGDSYRVSVPVFGGTLDEEKGFTGDRGIVLMRPNSVAAERSADGGTVSIEEVAAAFDSAAQIEVIETGVAARPSLSVEEANVIVAGGRGLGGPDGFQLLGDLAQELQGAVGSTRAAVDAGWIDYATQIGQTGKTVKPRVYIALGISGAVQHRVGMQTADFIVAVNKNPDAAIFQISDFGVVGDLFQVVPKLIEEIRQRKGA